MTAMSKEVVQEPQPRAAAAVISGATETAASSETVTADVLSSITPLDKTGRRTNSGAAALRCRVSIEQVACRSKVGRFQPFAEPCIDRREIAQSS